MLHRPAGRPRTTLGLLAGCFLLLLGGCVEEPGDVDVYLPDYEARFTQTPAERDSVLAALAAIDRTAFRTAFDHLDAFAYTRYLRTEQFTEDDELVAFDEQVLRYASTDTGRVVRMLEQDTGGEFDFGLFQRFVSEVTENETDPDNLAPYLLPEDPAYLDERNRDAYHYAFRPDTLLWDQAAQVIEIRARPVEGDGQNLRRVRLYVDRDTQQLVAAHLERIDLALLFREESQFYMHIRPAADTTWVPYNTRIHTTIRTPYRDAQQFRTVSTYTDVTPAG